MIRSKDTERADFIFYSNRIIRLHVQRSHVPGQDLRRQHHAGWRGHGTGPSRLLSICADRQDPDPAGRGDGPAQVVL